MPFAQSRKVPAIASSPAFHLPAPCLQPLRIAGLAGHAYGMP
jgi:hypothetical protein